MRIVIADDAALFREGVANLLREAGFDVVGQARDAVDLMPLVREQRPDVVILDIRMPPTHTREGLDAAKSSGSSILRWGSSSCPSSSSRTTPSAPRRPAQGAGYLLKDRVGDIDELAGAIRKVADGGLVIDLPLSHSSWRDLVGTTRSTDLPTESARYWG